MKSYLLRIHWVLLLLILILCGISIYNLHATTGIHAKNVHINQIYWFLIGFGVFTVVASIDYLTLQRLVPFFYITVNIALILVLIIGKSVNGSKRWIDMGFFTFQPSELAKIATILMLALKLKKQKHIDGFRVRDLLPIFLILLPIVVLIFIEPDLGHTLMIFFISGSMLAFEPFKRKTLVILLLSVVVAVPFSWNFLLKSYQKERVLTLLDQKDNDQFGSNWHANQALIAVGSGGIVGKGHALGTQVAGGFLPENHTDFVFAKWCEEQGFLGAVFVLSIYFGIILCAFYTAHTMKDSFGILVAIGVGAMIFWNVFMNVGMVLGLLPVTGVTLPLMTYGGTSAITVMMGLGLLMNVHLRRGDF